jgi:hypothetical protein
MFAWWQCTAYTNTTIAVWQSWTRTNSSIHRYMILWRIDKCSFQNGTSDTSHPNIPPTWRHSDCPSFEEAPQTMLHSLQDYSSRQRWLEWIHQCCQRSITHIYITCEQVRWQTWIARYTEHHSCHVTCTRQYELVHPVSPQAFMFEVRAWIFQTLVRVGLHSLDTKRSYPEYVTKNMMSHVWDMVVKSNGKTNEMIDWLRKWRHYEYG